MTKVEPHGEMICTRSGFDGSTVHTLVHLNLVDSEVVQSQPLFYILFVVENYLFLELSISV